MKAALDLRLMVITDVALAAPRTVEAVIDAAVRAGAPAVQLRDKQATAGALLAQARRLIVIVRSTGALLFINDRIDVAIAAGADGVHLGPADVPVAAARRIAPPHFLIGYSTDDPALASAAEAAGATYIGCGSVFGTTTKETGGERVGVARVRAVVDAVGIPVIGIGGVTRENAGAVMAAGAAGVAVVGAVMGAPDPARATTDLLLALLRS
ncbi:MAG TPA: thiamine phosphate synthase [Longimicrobiales bacterium]|nr:thiamine phosphate synthase [Longimicrobiales bacterium]